MAGAPLILEFVDGFDLVNSVPVPLKYQFPSSTFFFSVMGLPTGLVPPPDKIGQTWDVGNTGLGGAMSMTTGRAGSIDVPPRDTWIVNLSVQFKTNGDNIGGDPSKTFYPRTPFLWGANGAAAPTDTHTLTLLTIADPSDPADPAYGRVRLQLWAGGSAALPTPDPQTDTNHVTLWTSPYLVDHSHRYYFQLKFQQLTGLIELWIDGAMVYTTTNPALFGGLLLDYWELYHQHYVSFGNSGPSFDDFVVFSKADATIALPLPMRVYSVIMGADVSKAWNPLTPPNNVTMIYDHTVTLDPPTEQLPDFDSTYVSSGGSVVAETYKTGQTIWDTSSPPLVVPTGYLPAVPNFSKIYGIGLNVTCKSVGILAGLLRGFVNGSDVGTDVIAGDGNGPGTPQVASFVHYLTNQYHSMTDPLTGLPWLAASVRAANWGYRQSAGDDVRTTAFYLEIVGILGPPPPPPGGGPYIRATGAFALG